MPRSAARLTIGNRNASNRLSRFGFAKNWVMVFKSKSKFLGWAESNVECRYLPI